MRRRANGLGSIKSAKRAASAAVRSPQLAASFLVLSGARRADASLEHLGNDPANYQAFGQSHKIRRSSASGAGVGNTSPATKRSGGRRE
jgi:hypothetical protein